MKSISKNNVKLGMYFCDSDKSTETAHDSQEYANFLSYYEKREFIFAIFSEIRPKILFRRINKTYFATISKYMIKKQLFTLRIISLEQIQSLYSNRCFVKQSFLRKKTIRPTAVNDFSKLELQINFRDNPP